MLFGYTNKIIPYNKTDVPEDYETPSKESATSFVDIVRSYNVKTVRRQTLGDDIASACGQLVIDQSKKCAIGDMEDLGVQKQNSKPSMQPRRSRAKKATLWNQRGSLLLLLILSIVFYKLIK